METVEKYLERGGKIKVIPTGVSADRTTEVTNRQKESFKTSVAEAAFEKNYDASLLYIRLSNRFTKYQLRDVVRMGNAQAQRVLSRLQLERKIKANYEKTVIYYEVIK